MAAILKVWHQIRLRQSIHIYLKNIPAQFHPDPIWNDRAVGFFLRGHPNKKKKMSTGSDMK